MKKLPYTNKELIFLCLLLCVYSFTAFLNLGSPKSPHTGWKPASRGESFLLDLGGSQNLKYISYFGGLTGGGRYDLEYSPDGTNWIKDRVLIPSLFAWKRTEYEINAAFIRLTVETPDSTLYEIGLWSEENGNTRLLPVKKIIPGITSPLSTGTPADLFDEQAAVPFTPSFYNSMYFDEIYTARTAYEYLHGMEPFEWTHPPLGKLLIASGILISGMDPFGWRLAGALFGIAMIAALYILARNIFRKREYAFFAAFLLSVDFLHFVQSRIATVDVFAVFFIILMYYFMYRFYTGSILKNGLKGIILPLFFCGLFFGLGIAVKWICFYAGAGLAVLFFITLFDSFREYRTICRRISNNKSFPEEKKELSLSIKRYPRSVLTLAGLAACFFILVPIIITILSYIPTLFAPGHEFTSIWNNQVNMLRYHSSLTASHPYSSKWWTWPLMLRPVWYYSGQEYLQAGMISSIAALGNPVVWWAGIPAIIASLIIGIKRRDKIILFIIAAFSAQYIPWIFIQRPTWIYHFFAGVPFMVLCIVYILKYLRETKPGSKYFIFGYMAAAAVLFILFYPILSGIPVGRNYAQYLRWLQSWTFYM